MKKEIKISDPQKLLPWIGAPFMAAWIFEGVVLFVGFTPNLLFINYLIEGLFAFLFFLSYRNRYKAYKNEPNIAITKYFWVELSIHILFMIGAVVQSACNVWIEIGHEGFHYRHEFFFITALILLLHIVFMCIDYYATDKAAIIQSCKQTNIQSNK